MVHPGKELFLARMKSGLTLRKLAAFADTSSAAVSQIETGKRGVSFERLQSLLNLSGHRLVTINTNAKTPGEVSELIKSCLELDNRKRAYRAFIAYSMTLKSLNPGVRVALTLNRPESTSDSVFDAAIASLIEHWLSEGSLPIPEWVHEEALRLILPTQLSEFDNNPTLSRELVPEAFLQHNVLISAEALESL